ncbi:hypothetical protein BCR34DRAFT_611667 [Clohesyomyces aquaticus]|uniref:Uncharacterized protein n=1 Tax=Clohesyomyces aquaticus TaxID=1231657 RepID=A0A1Y2A1C9_9PLEO|nr:hypothetical protein BCR34DRAFT_611667 [Clohesyomyces aquaticus]
MSFEQYLATHDGDLADFILPVHRRSSIARKVKELRFQSDLDGMTRSGIYELFFGEAPFRILKNENLNMSKLPELPHSLSSIREDVLLSLRTLEAEDDVDLSFYVPIVAACFAAACPNISVIEIPHDWSAFFPRTMFPSVPGVWVADQPGVHGGEGMDDPYFEDDGYWSSDEDDADGWLEMGDKDGDEQDDEEWTIDYDADSSEDSDWEMTDVEGPFELTETGFCTSCDSD